MAQYKALEQAGDRKSLGHFIRERFDERYFRPVEDSCSKNGFASLAVSCLVVESVESFYQGLGDTRNESRRMFRDFFNRDTPLKVFAGGAKDWFFEDIRSGILHQAEARKGWRVLRTGPLVDPKARTINATRFLRVLRREVAAYAEQIAVDDAIWQNFQKKMKVVCDNCVPNADARPSSRGSSRAARPTAVDLP
ncbi:MAG: hypothetical protein ABSD98_09595 [Candidatus Korobacteraceae bacterium]